MDRDTAGTDAARTWRRLRWGAVALTLLVPLVAMQLTDAVAWTASDFVAAAALLGGGAALYEVAIRVVPQHRRAAAVVLAAAVLLLWAEGAVGIL